MMHLLTHARVSHQEKLVLNMNIHRKSLKGNKINQTDDEVQQADISVTWCLSMQKVSKV